LLCQAAKTFATQIHQSSPSESSRETELRDTIELIDYSAIFISAELIAPVELRFSTIFPWEGSNRKEMFCALCGIAVNYWWGTGEFVTLVGGFGYGIDWSCGGQV
jgi:hypothetical protein